MCDRLGGREERGCVLLYCVQGREKQLGASNAVQKHAHACMKGLLLLKRGGRKTPEKYDNKGRLVLVSLLSGEEELP